MLPLEQLAAPIMAAVAATPAEPVSNPGWLYVVGSGGLVVILGALIKLAGDLYAGRAQTKEKRAADLVTQRDTAWRERDEARRRERIADRRADCEAKNGRALWKYAARMRRLLIMHGVPETEIPHEPELIDCDLIAEDDDGEPRQGDRPRRR